MIRLPLLLSKYGSFVHKFPMGVVENNGGNRNASSHPHFDIADICF